VSDENIWEREQLPWTSFASESYVTLSVELLECLSFCKLLKEQTMILIQPTRLGSTDGDDAAVAHVNFASTGCYTELRQPHHESPSWQQLSFTSKVMAPLWKYEIPLLLPRNSYVADWDVSFYRSLTPRTRALIGGGVMVYALTGLFLTDVAEKTFGLSSTDEDRKKLEALVPKVRTIERGGVGERE